ncbi:UDP-N-acetylmuramoyl-L-alanyl-D-glutamate--2,6-diaminopimelate ligase [Paraferrimonas sp. SM1919]|uniref:UDP-N-acetylmuramoyl-L-alanyl-D-glutamate--2, 6-diaminopimelate ligase n=1 Tax=Paraferrimonas sp. SM1919 TaxID=2662263 RepID=UPI0013D6822D|nr:UDP-N-acetylmuramoyl-L-alanyl-D-glutamate--2,6-diaminopimelate ligase [Paraferrimonas sp. SM1919]
MTLISQLLAPWFPYSGTEQFNNIHLDSRQLQAGDLFVAVAGHQVDGRQFINSAISAGAVAVIQETNQSNLHGQVEYQQQCPVISFFGLSRELSQLGMQAYPLESALNTLLAVTGTNGKTSVTQLMAQLVTLCGQPAAVFGTNGNGLWGSLEQSLNTTSDPLTICRNVHHFAEQGAHWQMLEVSSHGLVQGRTSALPFKGAVFTNLSRDHLDYHGDMDNYALAKRRLFDYPNLRYKLFNIDDSYGALWQSQYQGDSYGYSVSNANAHYHIGHARFHESGVEAEIVTPKGRFTINSPLLGEFNLSNLLAALAMLDLAGLGIDKTAQMVTKLTPIDGRMEKFAQQHKATIVVDYAHTPDALKVALQALQKHCQGKLWCVFGCGGDRDRGKRPLMTDAAISNADRVVLTADNPRSELVSQILSDMTSELADKSSVKVIEDRQQAIAYALEHAKAEDVILVAGKGHETYQEIRGIKHPYNERAYVAKLMEVNQ